MPASSPSTLILIPAYNEAGRIGGVVQDVRRQGLDADIVVVDDGSSDTTAAEARAWGAAVIRHPDNLGYGTALHTGYLYACRHGYERLVQMDGDGQHDPECVRLLLDALDCGLDVVVGSRYHGKPPPTSLARRTGSRLFAWIASRWTGVRITDPTSGFQGISRKALAALAHDGFPEDYPDTDVLITMAREGMSLGEVPVRMFPRRGGTSMHRGARTAYYAYKMFLTLLLLPIREADAVPHAGHGRGDVVMLPQLVEEASQPLLGRQKLIAIGLAVCVLVAILELVRRRKLREEYSILWVVTAVVLLVLALQQDLILYLTHLIGAVESTSTLFFGALVFLMLIALQFSVRLSKLTHRNRALSQRIALLEHELERLGGVRPAETPADRTAEQREIRERMASLEAEIVQLRQTRRTRTKDGERSDGVA